MKLFKISQNVHRGWDTYSDAVVAAISAGDAALIHPDSNSEYFDTWPIDPNDSEQYARDDWADVPGEVTVEYLGEAKEGTEEGVICASFHAG
jgi:hypothetical protein